jgi:uncharacterized protein YbjT (DUF2867 family)
MYAITGVTGKVGGAVARTLLSAGQRVRAIVRDADKAGSGPNSVAKSKLPKWRMLSR